MATSYPDLTDDYNLDKEPVARYRMSYGDKASWSGHSYVVVLMNGESRPGRVKVVADSGHCDHVETICLGNVRDGQACVDSWQYDYSILWSRTAAGRKLISILGVHADRNQNPNHPAAKFNRTRVAS